MLQSTEALELIAPFSMRQPRKKLSLAFAALFIVLVAGFFGVFCFGGDWMATALPIGSQEGLTLGIVVEQGLIVLSVLFSLAYVCTARALDRRLASDGQ